MTQVAPYSISAPLSELEARALTDRIRQTTESLWSLLLESYEREAWRALGYATWQAYVEAEFSMSRSNSYRLLDQGRVIRTLSEAAGADVPHAGQITQRAAEAIKGNLPEVAQEVRARVDRGEEPGEAVRAVVETRRQEQGAKVIPLDPDCPACGTAEEGAEEDDGYDLTAELEEAHREIRRLETENDALASSDLGTEVRKLSSRCAQLEGRIQQLLTESGEAKRQATRQGNLLKKIRTLLKVERDSEIMGRLEGVLS